MMMEAMTIAVAVDNGEEDTISTMKRMKWKDALKELKVYVCM